MPQCRECGDRIVGGSLCDACANEIRVMQARMEGKDVDVDVPRSAPSIRKMMVTTETAPVGIEIVERVDIVTAECALGMNVFRDIAASARDFFGGRSNATQAALREAKDLVLQELREEASRVGANAIVGVSLSFSEFGTGRMLLIVATGTAVKLEQDSIRAAPVVPS
jgi:uncharacterized protein YbjQ (UPF0145 family)